MAAQKKKKDPGGQPTKYKKEYCKMLIQHMGVEGLSFESFAADVDVDRDTVYEWTNDHEAFSDAKRIGRQKALTLWEKMGRGLGVGKLKGAAPVYIFSMKHRFNWQA